MFASHRHPRKLPVGRLVPEQVSGNWITTPAEIYAKVPSPEGDSKMATLTIDGVTLEVVGTPDWAKFSVRNGRPSQAFIAAMVQVPASVMLTDLTEKTNAHVVLELGDGRKVEGHGLWRTGDTSSNGYIATIQFEGDDVVEHF
jgi:hypothetical protein